MPPNYYKEANREIDRIKKYDGSYSNWEKYLNALKRIIRGCKLDDTFELWLNPNKLPDHQPVFETAKLIKQNKVMYDIVVDSLVDSMQKNITSGLSDAARQTGYYALKNLHLVNKIKLKLSAKVISTMS